MGRARKPRSDSKMYQLPKELRDKVNAMLLNDNTKYSDIQKWLLDEHGLTISLSSISNYAKTLFESAQKAKEELLKTRCFMEMIADSDETDKDKAAIAILESKLLQRLVMSDEEFDDMSLEQASKILTRLTNNKIAEQRLDFAKATKENLALDAMERDLMKQLGEHTDLKEQIKKVFLEFKNRKLANEI